MTKNTTSKSGSVHRSNTKIEKKIQSTLSTATITTHTDTLVSITVQKANVDSKMLTPEQKRLANLMNDKIDVIEIERKINKIIELTGASKDKAIVALHDCANELDKAIDMILEGDSINESEWKSQARKKKSKSAVTNNREVLESKTNLNGETKRIQTNKAHAGQKKNKNTGEKTNQNLLKEKSNKKDFRKSQSNEYSSFKDLGWEIDNNDKLNEWVDTSKKTNNYKHIKTKSSQERKDRSSGNRSSSFISRNNERLNSGNDRNISNNSNRNSRTYSNKNLKNTAFPNSIDTWTNVTANSSNTANTNINYSQMTVGNWSDVAANEELNENDENNQWNENNKLDSKVFASNKEPIQEETKIPNLASIVSGVKSHHHLPLNVAFQQQSAKMNPEQKRLRQTKTQIDGPILLDPLKIQQSQRQSQQTNSQNKIDLASLLKSSQTTNQNSNNLQDQQMNKLIRGNIQRENDTTTYGAVLLQRLQQRVTSLSHESGKSNIPEYVNDYTSNQSNDNIKNLVNIPSNNYDTQNVSILNNQQSQGRNQSQHLEQQQIDHGNKHANHRISNRRQTKIPETAVEMPISDHISSLNVQFGALDFTETYLNNENNSTAVFHEQINKKSKNQNDNELNSNLLNTVQENSFRNNSLEPTEKQQNNSSKDILQNMGQQVTDNLLERKQTSNSYNKSSLYNQQHNENINSYKNSYGNQNENHLYQSNYQTQNTNYGSYGGCSNQTGYSVNSYSSNYSNSNQNHNTNSSNSNNNNNNSNTNVSTQKLNLKDLDTSTSNSNSNNINTSSNSLGLVSNATVTTNVLKNSLTATGKNNMHQQPNVAAPNVAPLLGTPQYIMSQPGLSAFYPIYDVPMAGPGREHSFGYNPNTQDVKYSCADANDANNVQSTQAPVTQTPNHQIFSQFPPHYGFFYTGVNMMTQGLYQTATPFLPVQPPNPGPPSGNTHGSSNSSGFAKAQNQGAYGSHSAYSSAYDPLSATQIQNPQDYNKQNYSGPNSNNQQQQSTNKQMSSGVNDLSNNNMYTKSHAQLTKNYDKPNFQTGTPPPFGIVSAAAALGYNPNQYIPMLQPQSNPSMLHHTLQTDGNQNVNSSGVGSQRPLSQQQKSSASNTKNYYNWS